MLAFLARALIPVVLVAGVVCFLGFILLLAAWFWRGAWYPMLSSALASTTLAWMLLAVLFCRTCAAGLRAVVLSGPFLALLWVTGLFYLTAVILVLKDPDRWDLANNPNVRKVLWFVGVIELALVIIRWWLVALGREVPADPVGKPVRGRPFWLERLFVWLLTYPLLPLQLFLFWAISWLDFGSGLGIPDLVWDESWWWRFFAGLAVSLLFANVLITRYMLDRRPGSLHPASVHRPCWPLCWCRRGPGGRGRTEQVAWRWLSRQGYRVQCWSLFWFARDREIRKLGTFLLWLWPAALALFYFPKYFSPNWDELSYAAMIAGLAAGVLLTAGVVRRFDQSLAEVAEAERMGARRPPTPIGFGLAVRVASQLPGTRHLHPNQRSLHQLTAFLLAVPLVVMIVFVLGLPVVTWHPIWVICLCLAAFNSLYGVVTYHFAGLQYVMLVLCVLIGIVSNTQHPDKMSFPALDYETLGIKRPVDLDRLQENDDAVRKLNLVKTEKMLANFHAKWAKGYGHSDKPGTNPKPKLVIVANSGGGIRAAVWSAVVLEALEKAMPEIPGERRAAFRDHIRLMTGASGGMLGAGLYVADFENRDKPNYKLSDQLAEDSLWPAVQTMFFHDLPAVGVPWDLTRDRGRSLEDAWVENTRPKLVSGEKKVLFPTEKPFDRLEATLEPTRPRSPLEKTFAELKEWRGGAASEENCDRPSLVFSPMLVEDCRRLLITNLDLGGMTTTSCASLNADLECHVVDLGANHARLFFPAHNQSIPVVEFWRAFPNAYQQFQIKTAARMSATFPFVGPGVTLPTIPPRRVVDAGYFDNFGINLAAVWLHHNRDKIREHTSGVVIVEIRAYPRRKEKLLINMESLAGEEPLPASAKRPELFTWAMSEVSTPAEAIVNLYARGAYFRNDLMLQILHKEFNRQDQSPFFTTVVFECEQEAALSWTMPKRDLDEIRRVFMPETADDMPEWKKRKKDMKDTVQKLREWFGPGGTR